MNRLCPICGKFYGKVNGLYRCEDDNLFMDPQETKQSYSDEYRLHYRLYAYTRFSNNLMFERWNFISNNLLDENIVCNPEILLDYGCGADTFRKWLNEKWPTMKTFSYDPFLKPDHRFLKEIGKIEVLTFWDSFEHIRRLEIIPLIKARNIFMTIPIIDNVQNLTSWKHYVPQEHVWYFSSKALIALFEKWNYKLIQTSDFEEKLRSEGLKSFYFKLED